MRSFFTFLLVLLFTFGMSSSKAQMAFEQGEIILKDSTVINGFVELAVTYGSRVTYKMTKDGKERWINSKDVKSIKTPYKYIENITLEDKERLMSMSSDGKVRLFTHVTINPGKQQEGYGGRYSFNGPPTVRYVLMRDGVYHELKKRDFQTKLIELIGDQPLMKDRLLTEKLEFTDVEQVVADYNNMNAKTPRTRITAKIVDEQTKKPISEVKVSVRGTDVEATTNALGFFQINVYLTDTLLIEHPDYVKYLLPVPATNNFQLPIRRSSK